MGEGVGRYYHPGMFPIMHQIIDRRKLAPGVYDLGQLAVDEKALRARISHNGLDTRSVDFPLRALVFGNESAKISGQVIVNQDGSKTFKKIEIRPFDTDFDFEHNTWNPFLEGAREVARRKYDPENYGRRYGSQYRGGGNFDEPYSDRGRGRVYHPFTDSQLQSALRKPGAAHGLLPSFTATPPPAINEHLRYLDRANTIQAQAPAAGARAAAVSPANTNSPPIGNWIASMAGVDPTNPTQPQQSTVGASGGNPTPQRLLPPWVFFGSQ